MVYFGQATATASSTRRPWIENIDDAKMSFMEFQKRFNLGSQTNNKLLSFYYFWTVGTMRDFFDQSPLLQMSFI